MYVCRLHAYCIICWFFFIFFVFFFKQKTAYEMRISDWSSDVCSSDLHDDRILVRLDVVALADAGRHEPEALVERLRAPVAGPHLEGEVLGSLVDAAPSEGEQQPGAELVAVPAGVDRDGRDVPVLEHAHEPSVAHAIGRASCRERGEQYGVELGGRRI